MEYIQTPMMNDLYNTLDQWTLAGFTGALIVGDARLGKSVAVRNLLDKLKTSDGEAIPTFYITFAKRDKNTIRSVYFRIAQQLGFTGIKKTATADELADLLTVKFADAALVNRQRKVVLIADEAQELSIDQLSAFAELYNAQDLAGNDFSVYFIANTQRIKGLAKELLEPDNDYLRERFFYNLYNFYGIKTLKELKACLKEYDKAPCSPNSTESLVDFHCPRMRAQGFSLLDLAPTIWDVYQTDYAKPLHLQSWGMTYFQRAIMVMIKDYLSAHWNHNDKTIRDIVKNSIDASGIISSLKAV